MRSRRRCSRGSRQRSTGSTAMRARGRSCFAEAASGRSSPARTSRSSPPCGWQRRPMRGSARGLQKLGHRMDAADTPFVAAIQGFCLGGGLELAMCCDVRVCSDDAQLGQPEVKLGLIPGGGGTQRLPRLVGPGRALLLNLGGEFIDAATAYGWGLVERVVPRDELLDAATSIAANVRGALAACRRRHPRAGPHDARSLTRRRAATGGGGVSPVPGKRGWPGGSRRIPREARAGLQGHVTARSRERRGPRSPAPARTDRERSERIPEPVGSRTCSCSASSAGSLPGCCCPVRRRSSPPACLPGMGRLQIELVIAVAAVAAVVGDNLGLRRRALRRPPPARELAHPVSLTTGPSGSSGVTRSSPGTAARRFCSDGS